MHSASDLAWGDVPAWLAGIGTISAVGVALWLAGRETRQRAREGRRRQATQITAWLEGVRAGPVTTLLVQNASSQSAYQVIASLVAIQGAFRRDGREPVQAGDPWLFRVPIGQLPPGLRRTTPGWDGIGAVLVRYAVELAFQDADGRSWRRMGDGELEQLPVKPVEYYGLDPIVDWQGPPEIV